MVSARVLSRFKRDLPHSSAVVLMGLEFLVVVAKDEDYQ